MIQRGDHGAEVGHWQEFLVSQGYGLLADSDFGPATESLTKKFQLAHGLDVDGKVGPDTFAAAKSLGYQPTIVVTKPIQEPSALGILDDNHLNQINDAKLAKIAPKLAAKVRTFIDAAEADGVIIQITQGLRTADEQNALFAQGRTRPGKIVTKARSWQSNHNFGTAVDVAPVVNGKVSFDDKLYHFGKWADAAGLSWGGRWVHFKDLPHLELPNIPKPSVLYETYKQGGLAAVWAKYGAD